MLDNKIIYNLDSPSKKDQNKDYLSNLINDLSKIKNEAKLLFKNNKIEESKNKFLEGYNIFEAESTKIYKEYYDDGKINDLLNIFKKILSKIALCYFNQKNYKDAIIYDLKMIALDPKYCKSIVRLFKSYLKLNKYQQAIYYGELFLDFEIEIKDKFKGIPEKIEEAKNKLKNLQNNTIINNIAKFFFSIIIIFLSALLFYIFKKKC